MKIKVERKLDLKKISFFSPSISSLVWYTLKNSVFIEKRPSWWWSWLRDEEWRNRMRRDVRLRWRSWNRIIRVEMRNVRERERQGNDDECDDRVNSTFKHFFFAWCKLNPLISIALEREPGCGSPSSCCITIIITASPSLWIKLSQCLECVCVCEKREEAEDKEGNLEPLFILQVHGMFLLKSDATKIRAGNVWSLFFNSLTCSLCNIEPRNGWDRKEDEKWEEYWRLEAGRNQEERMEKEEDSFPTFHHLT